MPKRLSRNTHTAKTPQWTATFTDRKQWVVERDTENKRILFVPDCHVPYHDPVAYACMIEAARFLRPHFLVVLGDYADFYCVSSHLKRRDPMKLVEEAELAKTALRHLRNVCGPQLERSIFVAGNHEDRFDRYIADKAPELMGLTSISDLLGLNEGGWEYVPYMQSIRLGKLHITHDTGSAGPNAHVRAMDDFQGSALIGHTHRMSVVYKGNADGPAAVGAMFGWLGDCEVASSEYKHVARARRDFILGFGSGLMTPDGVVYLQAHPVVNGRTAVNGEVIEAVPVWEGCLP